MSVLAVLLHTPAAHAGIADSPLPVLQAGATVMFGTGSSAAFPVDSNLALGGGLGNWSARILATSKKLVCTAFVSDRANSPPTTSWQLTIIKKLTEKGE